MTESELLVLEPMAMSPQEACNNNANHMQDIRRRKAAEISYNEFYWAHMQCNWPLILTDVANDWECRRQWLLAAPVNDGNNTPNRCQSVKQKAAATTANPPTCINFDYLRKRIGNCRVPVADCETEYFNSHAKLEMDFFDFLATWQTNIAAETEVNSNTPPQTTSTSTKVAKRKKTKLYLKDWHLKAAMPDYNFYTVPKHFAADWLNEQLVAKGGDDYRFVYMGPKDTWTPFHADVFGSYSWSTNIIGCKKWLMLPPGEEQKLCDRLGNLPFRIDEQLLEQSNVRYFTLLQAANEAIFVPSGWYHQVSNLTDTISVNHNWFNACNLAHIWRNLQTNMQKVIAEIEDCRQMDNFEAHCQTMLRATFGLNYLDFIEHLEYVVQKRLVAINANSNNNISPESCVGAMEATPAVSSKYLLFDTYLLSSYHIRRDLLAIKEVLSLMSQDANILQDDNSCGELYKRCLSLEEHLGAQAAQ